MVYVPVDVDEAVRRECRRRRLSPRTLKTYLFCIRAFLNWSKKGLGHISKRDVREFLVHLSGRGLAGSTLNTYHMAVRFLFVDVLDKRMWVDLKYSKVAKKIPTVLTKEEVKCLFDSVLNDKHRLMVQLLYSAGLRVSELTNLRVEDLVFEQGFGFVRNGKGAKDRLFILSPLLNKKIKKLIGNEGLSDRSWLFTSMRKRRYVSSTVRKIVKDASRRAGIKKRVQPHTLRHSFSTHLIENGLAVNEVQCLLGHKSPETTMTYVHQVAPTMIGVKSPFDVL